MKFVIHFSEFRGKACKRFDCTHPVPHPDPLAGCPASRGAIAIVLMTALMLPALAVGASGHQKVTARGYLRCVAASGAVIEAPSGCDPSRKRFVFQSLEGRIFRFQAGDPWLRMLEDRRVRSQQLQVEGWLRSQDVLQLIKVYSVHQGTLYDIDFHCSVCNITTYAPGPCWCCQSELEFRERPVKASPHRQGRKDETAERSQGARHERSH